MLHNAEYLRVLSVYVHQTYRVKVIAAYVQHDLVLLLHFSGHRALHWRHDESGHQLGDGCQQARHRQAAGHKCRRPYMGHYFSTSIRIASECY